MRIFIGSAEDLAKERAEVISICKDLRQNLEKITGSPVEVSDWRSVSPRQGVAQGQIIEAVKLEKTDVFFFLFWHRFGMPPGPGRVSAWRTQYKMDHKNKYEGGVEYLSGTEEEFELALASVGNRKDKRLMVFKCDKPVPMRLLDSEQKEKLDFYLNERVRPNVFWGGFRTTIDLRLAVHKALFDAVLSRMGTETGVTASLDNFSENYNQEYGNLISDYVSKECDELSGLIKGLVRNGHQACAIRTPSLYDHLVKAMPTSKNVKILDVDIRRWNELLNEFDKVFSLNYSRKILNDTATAARAAQNDKTDYTVTRVLAITPKDLREIRAEIVSILKYLKGFIQENEVEPNIVIHVYIDSYKHRPPAWKGVQADFMALAKGMKAEKDVVLCTYADDKKVILREFTDIDTPMSAFATAGEISFDNVAITRFEKVFGELVRFSWPLQEATRYLENLTDKEV